MRHRPNAKVSGTCPFTFEYRIDGNAAADFEMKADYTVRLGRPATWDNPEESPEIHELTNFMVEVSVKVPTAEPGHRWLRKWVPCPADLLAKVTAWNALTGKLDEEICEHAETQEPDIPERGSLLNEVA